MGCFVYRFKILNMLMLKFLLGFSINLVISRMNSYCCLYYLRVFLPWSSVLCALKFWRAGSLWVRELIVSVGSIAFVFSPFLVRPPCEVLSDGSAPLIAPSVRIATFAVLPYWAYCWYCHKASEGQDLALTSFQSPFVSGGRGGGTLPTALSPSIAAILAVCFCCCWESSAVPFTLLESKSGCRWCFQMQALPAAAAPAVSSVCSTQGPSRVSLVFQPGYVISVLFGVLQCQFI